MSLKSGRFLWRHNNIVNYVINCLDTNKFSAFRDIPGHEATGGGTVPPEVCVTNLIPDITVWDKAKTIHLTYLSSQGLGIPTSHRDTWIKPISTLTSPLMLHTSLQN